MRGYGETDRPEEIEKYTLFHLVGDMIGVVDALGAERAVIVGHDWGAPVAWHAALLRPDRFRGVVGLSVPFRPRGSTRPTSAMPRTETSLFYQLYFQAPGVAEAELERDPRSAIRRLIFSGSGDALRPENTSGPDSLAMVPKTGGFLTRMIDPERLPPWLTEADVDFYGREFARTGFCGGLRRRPKTIASGRISRRDSVVPFGMKGITGYVEGRHFLVGDFDAFWIGVGIEFAADRQAGLGCGVRDQFDRDDNACERRSTPVLGDVAEHPVLDLVPLGSAGRIMADV